MRLSEIERPVKVRRMTFRVPESGSQRVGIPISVAENPIPTRREGDPETSVQDPNALGGDLEMSVQHPNALGRCSWDVGRGAGS